VADHMCLFSIAEDTGGSIRQPAAFCGITGLRTSYGRNSRYGIMPMASSLDTVGPMAKTVEGLATILEVMAGHDKRDATTVEDEVPSYTSMIKGDISGLKIGVPKEYFDLDGLEDQVKQAVKKQIAALKAKGCEVVDVSLPHTKYAVATYYIIVPSEDSSNMGRLDGIRYGVQAEHDNLYDAYAKSRAKGFPEEVKRRIMIGTYALSAGYYDAYYRKAQKVRTLIRQDFDNVFKEVDAIVTPTSPYAAFPLGGKVNDVLAMYLADVFLSPAALAGVPGLSVNAGETEGGLPIGMQIIGPRMGESTLLKIGNAIS
jgi:aspartyl-tRNA(Asn)/glutamyl-tRNA(Gln) amidotransferase subunit A